MYSDNTKCLKSENFYRRKILNLENKTDADM